MRKVYCYAEKEEKPEEIDHSGDIVKDLSSFDISDIKNRSFFFIGGEIIENPYYEPSEYMKHVYEAIDAQYEQFYRSDKDKKDAEEETSEQSPNDEMPDWIAEMPYRELIKKFPGGISEALEYAKKEKGLSVPEIHYNSSEPKKLGVKAFTKNAEVYLAPGEGEETLKHELGHVVQQKKEKIPATTKIGEQQVNLDPKLEQEADEIAKHIEYHIPEIISEKPTDAKTDDVIQFELPSDDEFKEIIKRKAKDLNIAPYPMNEILNKAKEYYQSYFTYLTSMWKLWYKNYPEACCVWALNTIKNENPTENELYLELESSVTSQNNQAEINRIAEIMDMLSTEKIFIGESGQKDATLHNVLSILTEDQQEHVKNSILKLKGCCDAEGVKSVLKGASKNVEHNIIDFQQFKAWQDTNKPERIDNCKKAFVKRLDLMANYIEDVYNNNEYNKEKIGKNYWIRSTGSDPHKNGEHALFLVGKKSGKIERIYKPHDLAPDAIVVGSNGMFAELNRIIGTHPTIPASEPALATMDIDTESHTEELINPKKAMTVDEAKKYFFRAGILDFITRAMAVIDLHCENIMPTEHGPVIIDAEIDFFDYSDSGFSGEDMTNALAADPEIMPNANSPFTIVHNGETLASGRVFLDKTPPFYQSYVTGLKFAAEQLKNKQTKDSIAKKYEELLPENIKIRILPVETRILAALLNAAIQNKHDESTFKETVDFTANEIRNGLTQDTFIFHRMPLTIDEQKLRLAISKTFENGTIIAMYAKMSGQIYLDDEEVGYISTDQEPDGTHPCEKTIIECMKQAMKEAFLEKINAQIRECDSMPLLLPSN